MASLFSSLVLSLCLLSSPFLSNANANANAHKKLGFTADLIHRDSPKSPFYNPTETPYERLQNAIQRSINRVNYFAAKDVSSNTLPQSDITSADGAYVMNISLGTPPFPISAIADTGSDLIWTQCKPCHECFDQEAPLFDPKSSSTYKDVSCQSSMCTSLSEASCNSESNMCSYSVSYGDLSYTSGNIAVDTLTLGSTDNRPVQLKNVVIGCGDNNQGTFSKKESGIIGLGGGAVSLISQLGKSIDGKFSYCLVPLTSKGDLTSKINFGTNAVVSGPGTVSTPLFKNPQHDTFYYVNLEAISVGSKRLTFPGGSGDQGNIIVDSGTTLTMLPADFYSELEDAVASSISAEKIKDPQGAMSLCYKANTLSKVPEITMHFQEADVKLDRSNSFIQLSQGVVCFMFSGGGSDISIYGNLSQMNFLVGFDAASSKLSFKPADCANM